MKDRHKRSTKPANAALGGRSDGYRGGRQVSSCTRCRKCGHAEPKYWQNYPHFGPSHKAFVTESSVLKPEVDESLDEHN